MWKSPIAICVVLLMSSCATDVASRYYAAQRYPARKVEEVQILSGPPSRPYEVIAEFQARGESPKGMRKRAAKIGADAVIVTGLGGLFPLNAQWADDPRQSNTYTRLVGNAIKYQ